jgi:YD repeat-containing protein
MRLPRNAIGFVLLFALFLFVSAVGHTAHKPAAISPNELSYPSLVAAYHGPEALEPAGADNQGSGIREEIPSKYSARYLGWKQEFLSTDAGRTQWNYYQNNKHLILTITISRDNAEGATTGKYKWNDAGQLVAATITLGNHLDAGYPNPIYFPVMNSLVPTDSSRPTDGTTLAATKLAHEFGHVNRTGKVDPALYQLQTELMPEYNSIFLTNGRNANDPRLVELAGRIGGTPVEIWEDREYWGEANAMLYLRDRITDESVRCSVFSKIKHSLDLYAKGYENRFFEIVLTTPNNKICGW